MDNDSVKQRINQNSECKANEENRETKPNGETLNEFSDSEKFAEIPTTSAQKDEYEHSKLNEQIYRYTFIPRIVLAGIWLALMGFNTYRMFSAMEAEPRMKDFDYFSPGIFTNLIGRGRDYFDPLWNTLAHFFQIKYPWYAFYCVLARFIQIYAPKTLPTVSMLISCAFLYNLIGLERLAFDIFQILIFWIVQKLNSKLSLWLLLLGYIVFWMNYYHLIIFPSNYGQYNYFTEVILVLNCARCISFYYDTWDRPNRKSLSSLFTCLQFCFYFPLTVWGPLDSFERYEKYILLPSKLAKPAAVVRKDFFCMTFKLVRFGFWIIFNELLLHILYFSLFTKKHLFLESIDVFAILGMVYWIGQFVQLKYTVMYGIPGAIAEADGLPMQRLPKCITHIHRYSNLWKALDSGMYTWFLRYCYIPVCEFIAKVDKNDKLKPEFRRILAMVAPFIFTCVWHHGSNQLKIWAFVNFVLISAEKVASFLKRKIDSKYDIPPAIWDVAIEPIVSAPLGPISGIMNTALFLSTPKCAQIMIYRSFTETYHYLPLAYCFSHLGVLVATWPKVYRIVFRRSKVHLKT